ncbi:MAG TPA: phospho-N-acetylmuramoyl-pentapeptide-transferase [Candidatus Sabulitectum sp.]|nr:phospho-N-acetylmuramoyl-pentapeptide-transferase [Candidatus Sabulitectum sp.]HPF32084.1 phospho-N-acetylmuramoyl-pentapeptide-transferase [Candidatus Sabulitectum sp.]HPJ28830.1 phospho-N-acetylmuramoyl-pentapeptide-transferase [Candidatus Sabulitectum sp.]HPR22621.1 phospho-N-acetylmuramoyl-pentapeptide-transferase [Candidatus Sabulitectum sp.]HRW77503.1 phospho-N-acetylmuramoyl-pentapeptide-transferase [Candidatus Sabulitectum sp.]
MLQWLLYPLRDSAQLFNLFGYITFRAAGATLTAMLISFLFGGKIIAVLRSRQIGQEVRDDGPKSHLSKQGTPTMGGLIILISILIPVLLWGGLDSTALLVVLVSTVWMGLIGLLDDYLKVVKHSSKGLIGRYKLAGQILLGLIIGVWLFLTPPQPQSEGVTPDLIPGVRTVDINSEGSEITIFSSETTVPFVKSIRLDLGVLYILLVILVLTGTSNAVNLTDGLDGLATGVSLISILAFGALAYFLGHANFASYLQFSHLPGVGEVFVFAGAAAGACLGFLWYNANPAEVFMGDTGSLALGGAIGSMAVVTRNELLLALVGGVFVAEALSVMIQVSHFRKTGRRVFRMAPIHHHFELLGWPESKVVVRFWIIAAILALLGLSTFKIR